MKLLDIVKYRLNLPLNKELENRPEKVSLFKKVSMATLNKALTDPGNLGNIGFIGKLREFCLQTPF